MTEPEGGKWPYDFRIVAGNIILNSRGSVEAQGLICAALADAYAAGRASREPLRKALFEASGHSTYGEDDEYGIRCCCQVADYLAHAGHCELMKALSADEEAGK